MEKETFHAPEVEIIRYNEEALTDLYIGGLSGGDSTDGNN